MNGRPRAYGASSLPVGWDLTLELMGTRISEAESTVEEDWTPEQEKSLNLLFHNEHTKTEGENTSENSMMQTQGAKG